MRILEGHLDLHFHGQISRCPIAGVRDPRGTVEIAVATPFGLRRVHVRLDQARHMAEAHTFAFDYESGQVTRFEQAIDGGPDPETPGRYRGVISGGGLEGKWTITELGAGDDAADEAAYAFGVGARVPESTGTGEGT
ncbi:MAG: hypothetical protein KC620_09785 [Myxococcales bacterium]|nr:hypothetical protein [Myxococcales bacterium]